MTSPYVDFAAIEQLVKATVEHEIMGIDLIWNIHLDAVPKTSLRLHVLASGLPVDVFQAEVTMMQFIRERTSIPMPRVLAFNKETSHSLGPYILFEEAQGTNLETVFNTLDITVKQRLVSQIAQWSFGLIELGTFESIGCLYLNEAGDGYRVGPLCHPLFYTEGRAQVSLDRGPFVSCQAYFLACAEREVKSLSPLAPESGSASDQYKKEFAERAENVEDCMKLFKDLIQRCKGLDEGDPVLAPFALDMHEFGLRNFFVQDDDFSKVTCVVGWENLCSMPLWQCARLPGWLNTSLSGDDDPSSGLLISTYRQTLAETLGIDSPLLDVMAAEDTRCALIDLCRYDAFRDSFLLQPALESLSATMPGEEDIKGLSALLDPNTVTGRVARIALLTKGNTGETMSLAFPEQKVDPHYTMNDGDNGNGAYVPVIFPAPPGHRGILAAAAGVGKEQVAEDVRHPETASE